MKLFDDSIESTDPKYRLVRDIPKWQPQKDYVEELWTRFSPFAEDSFRADIAQRFHSHFWEMYLGCTLLELGYELVPRKTKGGPDLKLLLNGKPLWVEATAPDRGTGVDAVQKPPIGQVYQEPEEKILLRLTNSINEKNIKLKNYIVNGIVNPNDAFIIAINGFLVPLSSSDDEIPYILKAVLPFGKEFITFNWYTQEIIDSGYQYRSEIKKTTGSLVSTTAFQDAEYAGISGIIYSKAELWNLPASFGSDFLIAHNPIATNEIKRDWLRFGKHYWVEEGILKSESVG